MKIGDVITIVDKKWIIFQFWGENNEYVAVTDFETQTINELFPKVLINESDIEDVKVEWLFLKRREKNLKGLENYL